jgi:DNA-binding transcriptional ArsR family regulator
MSEIESLARKFDAAIEAYNSQRLRWVLGISQVQLGIDETRYLDFVNTIMREEIERHMIIQALRERGELTVLEISKLTSIAPSQILRHIIALRKNGVVTEANEKNYEYTYKLLK